MIFTGSFACSASVRSSVLLMTWECIQMLPTPSRVTGCNHAATKTGHRCFFTLSRLSLSDHFSNGSQRFQLGFCLDEKLPAAKIFTRLAINARKDPCDAAFCGNYSKRLMLSNTIHYNMIPSDSYSIPQYRGLNNYNGVSGPIVL